MAIVEILNFFLFIYLQLDLTESLFVNFTAISLNITSHMQRNIQNQLMKQLETHSRHIYEPHRLYMACDLISCHNKNFKTSELFSRRIIYFRVDDEFFFQAENK